MTTSILRSFRLVAWMLATCSLGQSQAKLDPIKVDPQHFKVEYEDDQIRVLRFRILPGESSPMHDNADRTIVVVSGGKIRVTAADGTVEVRVLTTGAVVKKNPTRHTVENIGTEAFEAVSTEFKERAYVEVAGARSAAAPADNRKPSPEATATKSAPQTPTSASAPSSTQPEPEARLPVERNRPAQAAVQEPAPAVPTANGTDNVRTVSLNGKEVAYIERGTGAPVIFLHDTLGDYRSLEQEARGFGSGRYRAITYSRRYHYPNHANGKERDYSPEENAKDLGELLPSVKASQAHIVGQGYGARLALLFAAHHPELVKSVTLIESDIENLLPPSRATSTEFAREEIYRIIRKPMGRGRDEEALSTFVDWWRGSGTWDHLTATERSQLLQNANSLKAQTYFPEWPRFSCEDAKKITAPVLLISAELAPPNTRDIDAALAACLPQVQRATVPHAAHMRDSASWAPALKAFLDAHY